MGFKRMYNKFLINAYDCEIIREYYNKYSFDGFIE